jgi:predicted dehydrogenase
MTSARSIGLGVVGLGVMGKAHVAACRSAANDGLPVSLVAVCDRNPSKLGESSAAVATYDDPTRLFDDPNVDAVALCTRTETHVELACAALRARKHVLVEKPLALRVEDLRPLLRAAEGSDRLVMPAMCMRFWPGWDWLKARVDDRAYGRVKSAAFRRLSAPPSWSRDFYGDPSQSGGALVDLHIHDADFVRHLFGEPRAVATTGDVDHVTTLYFFDGQGPRHVTAEGGWDHAPGFAFRMQYVVVFEDATAEFDSARDPRLALFKDGAASPVPLAAGSGYDGQLRAFVAAIAAGATSPVTLDDATRTAALLDAERTSLLRGGLVAV